jgi:hypothetical protein
MSDLRAKMASLIHPRLNESILSPHAKHLNTVLKMDNVLHSVHQPMSTADARITVLENELDTYREALCQERSLRASIYKRLTQLENALHQAILHNSLLEDLIKQTNVKDENNGPRVSVEKVKEVSINNYQDDRAIVLSVVGSDMAEP